MKIKLTAIVGLVIAAFAVSSNAAGGMALATVENTVNVAAKKEVAVSPALPSFKVIDQEDSIINLADLKGRKVFVNLWATWCPPCRAEMPSIEKLQSKVDKQKVAFVMLSLDDNFDKAKRFAKVHKLQLPVYYPIESLPAVFNTDGIPATFIFNEKGELIRVNNGAEDYNTEDYLKLLK